MRKFIIILVTLLIAAIGVILFNFLRSSKENKQKPIEKIVKLAFVDTVKNNSIPIQISANGSLIAKNRIELYSEVQGVLSAAGKEFKPGVKYSKGETLLRINNEEHLANLQSQRSNLQNLIASIMPDIRLDYASEFDKWNSYLQNFNINSTTQPLPETNSNQEEYFITGRNIYTTYYAVKNLETRLYKHNIRAPFSGIVTEANVTKGTLIRAGQKMGEFIDTSEYELEVAVNAEYASILKVGKIVVLQNLEKTETWQGKVSRINGRVDQGSQTVSIFIDVTGKDLREGMYLEAEVSAKEVENAIEISRKLLVDNENVFVIKNNILELVEINPVYFDDKIVVIKGLENGTQLLTKTIPGAYSGMEVKIFKEN